MLLYVFLFAAAQSGAESPPSIELKQAEKHLMKYYVSLPRGWTAEKKWPVAMIIESADRDFENAARVFARARGDLPFILVTPMVTTNGGARYREAPGYRYTDADWNEIERVGRCQFDLEGLALVAADVQRKYSGEPKYFITGFEAGGHTVFPLLFRNPEALRAAAPVAPNYAGRCMEDGKFAGAIPDLPVRIFAGANDPSMAAAGPLAAQSQRAQETAEQHEFKNVSRQVVPGKDHEPLAAEVLAYFYSLYAQSTQRR